MPDSADALAALHPEIALDGTRPPDEYIVSAIFWVPATPETGNRYLMQLRDDKPGLPLRDHWALFGGHVEPGESGEECLRREMQEELSYQIRDFRWYHESITVLPRRKSRVIRKAIYLVPIAAEEVGTMVLGEGAAMRLFTVEEMLKLPRIAPGDLALIMTHARERTVYGD